MVEAITEHLWGLEEVVGIFVVSGVDDILVQLAVRDTDHLRDVVVAEVAGLDGVVDETTSLIFEHRRKVVISPL
ncbi:MAG: Lrp/AsnC ligand binding domain-containing protein [Acidimicrobiales bacterium]|nr:Lrp/AsnC ligand binding domain-containing protein [Acidimicrobiales bacterium]